MSIAISSPSTLVVGVANDPQLAQADGSRRRLAFFSDFAPGLRILDVGCGTGQHLRELVGRGHEAVGVELDQGCVAALKAEGYNVVQGTAERLPFPDQAFDAIVCSVVLPYTDERRAIAEWSRVLAAGGQVRASFHGIAFALRYLLTGPGYRRRFYGGRMIANSWAYALTGRRLPGFLGDTLVQSTARLKRSYRAASLVLVKEYIRPGIAGMRDVFFHCLEKTNTPRA